MEPGDRVVVGVSGGKDSIGMLYLLWWQRHLQGLRVDLHPVHVADVHDEDGISEEVSQWARGLGLSLSTVRADLWPSGASATLSPCVLCARNRKRALFEMAERLGGSVVALGHHSDDVAVTAVMNLFFQGRFGSILPRQTYFQGRFRLIRPLYFVSERSMVRLIRQEGLPVVPTRCAHAHTTTRSIARSWLETILKDRRSAKRSLLGALHRQALAEVARR